VFVRKRESPANKPSRKSFFPEEHATPAGLSVEFYMLPMERFNSFLIRSGNIHGPLLPLHQIHLIQQPGSGDKK
jgi:hypothetical protein